MTIEDDIRTRLRHPLPGADTHLRFAPTPRLRNWDPGAVPDNARRAAALLLLYPGPDGHSLVLTRRRADLPHHGGQISLPGGGLDPEESPERGALREAYEEIGVDPATIQVIGALSSLWVIVSGFVVYPIVGFTDVRPAFAPSPREVDLLIEAPLDLVRNPATVRWGKRIRDQVTVACPYFAIGPHQVWGATAMMLGEFCTALDASFLPPPQPERSDFHALPDMT